MNRSLLLFVAAGVAVAGPGVAWASPRGGLMPVFNAVYLANGFPTEVTVGVSHNGGRTYQNVPIKPKAGQDIICGVSCVLAVSTHGSVATYTAKGGHTYMLVFNSTRQRYEIRLPPT